MVELKRPAPCLLAPQIGTNSALIPRRYLGRLDWGQPMTDQKLREDIAAVADCARLVKGIIVGAAIGLFSAFVFSSWIGILLFVAALIIAIPVLFIAYVVYEVRRPRAAFDPPAFGWPRMFFLTDQEREYLGGIPWLHLLIILIVGVGLCAAMVSAMVYLK
jgi:uncharacterized membrane protein